MRFLFLFLILSGCLSTEKDSASSGGVSRAESISFSHLPDPTTWSGARMYDYFIGEQGSVSTAGSWKHRLDARVAEHCGEAIPRLEQTNFSWQQEIRFAEAAIQKGPEVVRCWSEYAPEAILVRAAELQYLQSVIPFFRQIDHQPIEELRDINRYPQVFPSVSETHLLSPDWDIDKEIEGLNRQFEQLSQREEIMGRQIARYKRYQREDRDSWARAATTALNDFAQDNPFNRPGPAQIASGWLSSGQTLSASNIPTSNPMARAAILNYHRNVVQSNSNSGLSGILISYRAEQSSPCAFGSIEEGNCVTRAEMNAQLDASRESMARATEQSRLSAQQSYERDLNLLRKYQEEEERWRANDYRSGGGNTPADIMTVVAE